MVLAIRNAAFVVRSSHARQQFQDGDFAAKVIEDRSKFHPYGARAQHDY